MSNPKDILTFWFQGVDDQIKADFKTEPFSRWFMKNDAFDQEIREKFEGDILSAAQGRCAEWGQTAKGRLALIILFDQFPRNIYRNTKRMFAFDSLALNLTLKGIEEELFKDLQLIEQTFCLMPLMHAENLEVQKKSLEYFQRLVDESRTICPENTPYYQYSFDYAKKHYEIIKRFGRFPHRNQILGRESTPAEKIFLNQSGSSF